jgi:hypothetical protein
MFSTIPRLFANLRLDFERVSPQGNNSQEINHDTPQETSDLNTLPHPRDTHQQIDTRDSPQVNMFKAKSININDGSFTINNTVNNTIGGGQGLQSMDNSTDADCS